MRIKEMVVSYLDGIKILIHDEISDTHEWVAINGVNPFQVGDEVELVLRKKETPHAPR